MAEQLPQVDLTALSGHLRGADALATLSALEGAANTGQIVALGRFTVETVQEQFNADRQATMAAIEQEYRTPGGSLAIERLDLGYRNKVGLAHIYAGLRLYFGRPQAPTETSEELWRDPNSYYLPQEFRNVDILAVDAWTAGRDAASTLTAALAALEQQNRTQGHLGQLMVTFVRQHEEAAYYPILTRAGFRARRPSSHFALAPATAASDEQKLSTSGRMQALGSVFTGKLYVPHDEQPPATLVPINPGTLLTVYTNVPDDARLRNF